MASMASVKPTPSIQILEEMVDVSLDENGGENGTPSQTPQTDSISENKVDGSKLPAEVASSARILYRHILTFVVAFVAISTLSFLFCLTMPLCLGLYLIFGGLPWLAVKVAMRSRGLSSSSSLLPISRVFGSTVDDQYNSLLLIMNGICDLEKIRASLTQLINNTSNNYSHLQRRLVKRMGYLCLEKPPVPFHINNHVNMLNKRDDEEPWTSQSDIRRFLETHPHQLTHGRGDDDEEPDDGQFPQWELLLAPEYLDRPGCYALILRCHNGLMDWPMMMRMFVAGHGISDGVSLGSTFNPGSPPSLYMKLKIVFSTLSTGPATLIRKLVTGYTDIFSMLKESPLGKPSMGVSKVMPSANWQHINKGRDNNNKCAFSASVQVSVKKLFLSQYLNLELDIPIPDVINVTRIFCSGGGGVDTFGGKRNGQHMVSSMIYDDLDAQRLFNKVLIWMSSTFPVRMAASLHRLIMKGDVAVHFWPGLDDRCKLFGGDQIIDMIGWSGMNGANADMAITVLSYSGFVRVSVVSLVGDLLFGSTAAKTMVEGLEEEYAAQAKAVDIPEYNLFLG